MSEFEQKFNEVTEWFNQLKKSMEVISKAYSIYEEFGLYKKVIAQIPETENELKHSFENRLIEPLRTFATALGPSLNIDNRAIEYSGATVTSGTIHLLDDLKQYSANNLDWYNKFNVTIYSTIEEIQAQKDSLAAISSQLITLFPPLGKEFEELIDLHSRYIGSFEYSSSFGIKMRNVLEHFKGICHKCAVIEKYGNYKENQELTWQKISEYVAKDGKGSKYDNQFSKLSSSYTTLWSRLSKDAKNYTITDSNKLEEAFIQLVQYLDAALILIDVQKIKKHL